MNADAIFVGGGNTLNMLAIWKAQGIDTALRKAYDSGILMRVEVRVRSAGFRMVPPITAHRFIEGRRNGVDQNRCRKIIALHSPDRVLPSNQI